MEGKVINGYVLKRLLGMGGMAEVWYAENKLGKKAAVKLLLPQLCADEGIKARFFTEAQVMVELDHPNIRQVYDYGDIDGRPTIVMEYLDGMDLKAKMKRGQRFSDEQLILWWNQLVDALNYTHQKGVVHRDIKPSNLFIDQKGDVKLLDFGIAKVADISTGTQTGSTLGTRIYMSPEQVKDPKRVGPASDVYSLAVSFVHLITGKAPYDSTTSSDFDIQVSIVSKPLDLSPLPEKWRDFLAPYLEKDPEKRPALRHYETFAPEKTLVATSDKTAVAPPFNPIDDEGTLVEDAGHEVSRPVSITPKPIVPHPISSVTQEKPKSKKGLWIGLAAASAVVAALVLAFKENPDEKAFKSCQDVDDYRRYVYQFGRDGAHYDFAKAYIEMYVEDSIEAEQQLLLAAAQQELADYQACTTVATCDLYLTLYPEGRFVSEVQEKKALAAVLGKLPQVEITTQNSDMTFRIGEVSFVMKNVEGGTFWMGATSEQGDEADSNEKPVHKVTVSSFFMGETEVTQALWKTVTGKNPCSHKGNNYPVETVSWYDCQNFINNLNILTGKKFRMPTEAEWEYAARGGLKSQGYKYAGSDDMESVAWAYNVDFGFKTHPVRQKKPNELGLYDMSGNVFEWCCDWYGEYTGEAQTNPKGPTIIQNDDEEDDHGKVLRGGSCLLMNTSICRVSYRHTMFPSFDYDDYGLRLAMEE